MNPANLIGRANGVKHLHTSNGNTRDIINAILYADKFCAPYTANAAAALKGRNVEETCYNIWKFWKDNVRYVEDPDGVQYIKSPGYLMQVGHGDCKSYSVAAASILQNLRIPYKYRFITEDAGKDYHHVYVVVPTSQGEIIIDCVLDNFNVQNAYAKKKDIAPQRSTAAGINGIGATQAEVVASNWLQFEKNFKDNLPNLIQQTKDWIVKDIKNAHPRGPIIRKKLTKALLENFDGLCTSGAMMVYNYWDDTKTPFAQQVYYEKDNGIRFRNSLADSGLRSFTIDSIAQIGCYNVHGITVDYMLYRCYNMVKYGQPWEPVPGVPYFDFRRNVFVNQGNTAESLAMTVKIGMCFPAAGGIARPFGQPYICFAGWYIKNGASDADFENYRKYYIPSNKEKDAIDGALPQQYFEEDYALYLKWLNGNMAALPSITNVSAKSLRFGSDKPSMGSAIGYVPVAEVTALLIAIGKVLAVIAAIISTIVGIVMAFKKNGNTNQVQIANPPADFKMEYQSVDGCFIGTAPAECGAYAAKYCPNGSFTCLTPEQMKLPENQQGMPTKGFAGLSASPSFWLFIGGGALLVMGLFSSSKSSAA